MNRVIEWRADGIWYEADQRHADLIVQGLGLDDRSKPAPTPSVATRAADEEPLFVDQSVMYRALVARAN